MIEAIIKTDEVIDALDKSNTVRRLKELKTIIDKDNKIQALLNEFNNAKSKYESNLITAESLKNSKVNLYNHPIVLEYRKLYSDLSFSVNKFNKEIIKLLDNNRTCGIK